MVLERGSLFDPVLVNDLVSKVRGKSTLAQLSNQNPIPFNGQTEFTFTMDSEIDVVAESGKKSHGGVTLAPRTIVPIKVEYGARVSDEFMIVDKEERIGILKAFNDGFAKKVARGLDLMAFHGVNPRTGESSSVIGDNSFDNLVDQEVQAGEGLEDPNSNVESAIAVVHGSGADVTGMAISTEFRSALAKQKDRQGNPMFPDLAWGNAPSSINGLPVEINRTVSEMSSDEPRVYIGDFTNGFKWGYAKQIPLKVIEYGDPDNSGNDLQGYNQVYLRAEAFLGWGILDPDAFAIIKETGSGGGVEG